MVQNIYEINSVTIFVIKIQNTEKHKICDINTFYCIKL